jgi:hypothetical protein
MIRKVFCVAVLAAMASVAGPVLAGGGSGGSKGSVAVRMKNVGVAPVAVNALSGSASLNQIISSARTVGANGVAQFSVRSGAFTAVAASPSAPLSANSVRSFNTRGFSTVYLYAQQDGTAATLVGAPGGVKF